MLAMSMSVTRAQSPRSFCIGSDSFHQSSRCNSQPSFRSAVCAFDQVLTFYSAYFILRVRITTEYQREVRDVFPIRSETCRPLGTKPRKEIQHLRTCDNDCPKRPIET